MSHVGLHPLTRATPVATRDGRRRLGEWVGDGLLTALALMGVATVVATVAAHLLGYQLVMFASGSMSPTIPAGSLALSRATPASELRVGQVVTIQRANARPITHRVVSIEAVPGSAGQRSVRVRGDANPVADATPYVVSQADVVLASVPGGAAWVSALTRGPVRVATGVLVAGSLLWAFWPRSRRPRRQRARAGAGPTA